MREPLSVADVLDRAADLIEPKGAWTQGTDARDENDEEVDLDSGVCWCAAGAIWHVARRQPWQCARVLEGLIPNGDIPEWNDAPERTQAEVVAKLREAAELARRSAEFGNIGADGVQS